MANNNNQVNIKFTAFNADFNKAMKEMDKESARLRQELKLQQEQMKNNSTESEKMEVKLQSLSDQYAVAQKRTQETAAQLERVKSIWGENSEEAQKLETQLRSMQITEQRLSNQMTDTNTKLAAHQAAQQSLNDVLQRSGKSINDFADVLSADLRAAVESGNASTRQLEAALRQVSEAAERSQSGFKQYENAMSQLESASKRMRQEMKLEEEQLKGSGTETERYEASIRGITQQQQNMALQINTTAQQLARAKAQYGENSKEAQQLETRLVNLRIAQQQFSNQITDSQQALQRIADAQQAQEQSLRSLNQLFDITGNSIDEFADVLGQDLVRAIQNGTASARDIDVAFDRIANSAIGARVDVNELRQILFRLNNGGSLDEVRQDIEQMRDSLNGAENDAKKLSSELGNVAKAAAGAAAGALSISAAMEQSHNNTKVDILFNVDDQGTEAVRQAVANIQAYGVEGEEALEGARRQWALNKDATDETNAAIVKNAGALTSLYAGLDFAEVIQEANEIGKELDISTDAALKLADELLYMGFPPQELDIIAEFGGQLKRAGFEAEQVKGIMAAAVESGSWDINNLLDGLKEGRIRAAEMGRGLSEGFKDALREVVDGINEVTDEEIAAVEASHAKKEDVLQKSLDKQMRDKEKAFDAEEKAFEKSLDSQLKAAEKNMEAQERALQKSLDSELKAFEDSADARIAIIDKEYRERLKLTNEEEYKRLQAIDNQIAGIEGLIEADEKATQLAEENAKRAELQKAVDNAKSSKNRQDAEEALASFEADIQAKRLKEERQGQIENLKAQKDDVKELYDDKEAQLKEEYEQQKSSAEQAIEIEKEAIKERQSLQLDAFKEQKENYLSGIREQHAEELAIFRESQAEKLRLLQESQSEQMAKLQNANAVELDTLINPPDSAQFKALEAQLEGWGKAIAEGGEAGTQAFADMTQWLNGIEDKTLQNAIATEVFGTSWEDQGENILYTLQNHEDALGRVNQGQSDLNDKTKQMDESAIVSFNQAMQDLQIALTPVLQLLAGVITSITNWVSQNPIFAAGIATVIGAITTLSGALVILKPLFGLFGDMSGVVQKLLPHLTKIVTWATNLTRFLPMLMNGFRLLTGPIGWVITAATLIIQNWDSIKTFFSGLFSFIGDIFGKIKKAMEEPLQKAKDTFFDILDGIKDKFGTAFDWISDKVSGILEGIGNMFKAPINIAIDGLNFLIRELNKVSFDVPDWVPGIGSKKFGFDIPEVKYFADGGIMTKATMFGASGNTAFVGGEAGREAILPLRADILAGIGKGIVEATGMGNQMVVHNYERMLEGANFSVRSDDDIKSIARELYNYQQRASRGR